MNKADREAAIQKDMQELHKMGYAQELFREMGGFSNFAISFSIISILTGAILLYGYGLKFAGPIINTVGWPLVSILTWTVAASMAEMASAFPTAGGLYYWAYRLGGRGWAWVTAWLNMLGQITITAGINVAAAIYIVGMLQLIFGFGDDAAIPLFGTVTSWGFYIFVMVLIMIPQVMINAFGIRLTAKLNDFSVYWHIIGVLVIAFLLTVFGKYHNDMGFVFQAVSTVKPGDGAEVFMIGGLEVQSIWFRIIPGLQGLYDSTVLVPFSILAFALALLQAQWTYTGYDASAHVAEETVLARLNSAWGVFLSVFVSSIVGYIVLMALTFAIPNGDIEATANAAYPVLYIAQENLAPFLANVIGVIIAVAMWLCGLASITSMSRMWFAFARDDGMPGANYIKKVSHTWRTPVHSIVVTSIIAVLICVYASAFYVVTSISVMALYLAYGIPTFLNLRKGRKFTKTKELAPWNLGKWGTPINVISLVWILILTVLFSLPPNELAGWTMIVLAVFLVIYWFASEKRRFTGPRLMTAQELADIEGEFAVPGGVVVPDVESQPVVVAKSDPAVPDASKSDPAVPDASKSE
ncbi:MAG: amino acid permease [Actinobacteria bacterium]|nr:amino acid permease [Actinomycetota bacterium]